MSLTFSQKFDKNVSLRLFYPEDHQKETKKLHRRLRDQAPEARALRRMMAAKDTSEKKNVLRSNDPERPKRRRWPP